MIGGIIMKFFSNLITQLRYGISRYIIAFYGSIIMFVLTSVLIFGNQDDEVITRLLLSALFVIFVSVAAQTVSIRYRFSQSNDLLQKIVSALTAIPCYFLINNITDNEYVTLGYFGVVAAVISVAAYFLFTDENGNLIVPHLVKNMFFAGFIGLLFFGGITLCIYAIHFLIYDLGDIEKYIFTILAFSYEVLALNLFLSLLPREQNDINIPKAFKILVFYVAFPIYLLLLAVLYVYLIKILVTFNMPGGQINWFASFAALFFIFFRFTIIQYDQPITRFYARFGGYFMLPIFAAQAVAVYIRLNVYGLTTARYLSLLMTATAFIFTIISLIKSGRYVKLIIPVCTAIFLLASVTPLNIIDVPLYEQAARLESVLKKNNMLDNGVISPNPGLNAEDKKRIQSSYNYLIYQDNAPEYIKGKNFADLFGFEQFEDGYIQPRYINKYSGNIPSELDISGYTKMFIIDRNSYDSGAAIDRIIINIGGADYDITDYILSLEDNGSKEAEQMSYTPSENIVFYFNTIECSINADNTISHYYIRGFALTK